MASKTKKTPRGRGSIDFEISDLFGEGAEEAAGASGGHKTNLDESTECSRDPHQGAEAALVEPKTKKRDARRRAKKGQDLSEVNPTVANKNKTSRWKPSRGFKIFTEGLLDNSPEHHRVRRKFPSPEILDETLLRLMGALAPRKVFNILCDGSVFPAVAAVAAGEAGNLFIGGRVDQKAREAVNKLLPDARPDSESEKFDSILFCYDHVTGEKAAESILSSFFRLREGGVLVACFPAEAFLDYATNIRMEAPNMRNRVHRVCSAHFILRAAGPLMQPSWDILVLSRRGGAGDPPICKWRFTGNGVLPWQKCNEAFSSAPWLLVESIDQAGPAVARCISYPWEPFPSAD